jgi:RNA polymerase sigma-70 factor (ECF subfamily)
MTSMPDRDGPQSRPDLSRQAWFDHLSQSYRVPLTRFFQRRVGSKAEAEDLAQDVFVRLLRRMDGEPINDPEAFLFRTAVNLLRDRTRRDMTVNSNAAELADRQQTIEALSPERVLEGKQLLRTALQALNELDARSRDIFILNRLEGMKYAQIAQLHGLSVSSIEKIIVKVVAHLLKRGASI